MRSIGIRFVAVCIVVSIALLPAGCRFFQPDSNPEAAAAASPTPLLISAHPDTPFSEITYVRPDTEQLSSRLDALMEAVEQGAPASELLGEYEQIQKLYNSAESQQALAYLLYAFDVTQDEYQQEYALLQSALTALDLKMTDVSIALFESSEEAGAAAREAFGEEYVDTVYAEEALNDETIQDLLDAETELVNEYDRLTAEFSVPHEGSFYTLDDILTDMELDYETSVRLYNAYCQGVNEEAGALFVELLGIRSQIAGKLGYGSYAAYCYDRYGRDYTITDAKALHAAVKKHIVPVFVSGEGDSAMLYELYTARYELDKFLQQLQTAAADFSIGLSEPLGYMLKNELYDFSVNPKKMTGSFTTYFSDYQTPFIFSQWTGASADVNTVIHELGHFSNYYHNPAAGWSAGDSLDLAEVDSQALQLLMTPYFGLFFGDLAEAAKSDLLLDCMYALITGCMEDEFQQRIYADPSMTLEQMNALYFRLADEYGLSQMYGYTGIEWVLIAHTFQSPMYYISYAASMVPALELWEMSQTDAAAARKAYFSILNRRPYAAFRETLRENGLNDVFSERTIRSLAALLNQQT